METRQGQLFGTINNRLCLVEKLANALGHHLLIESVSEFGIYK